MNENFTWYIWIDRENEGPIVCHSLKEVEVEIDNIPESEVTYIMILRVKDL